MMRITERLFDMRDSSPAGEAGWALLGLLLALSVMSIFLVSAMVPNVQKQVQRDKEAEMIYRGEQMAQGIARYYGRGNLVPLNILMPPTPLPYLTDLTKLRDGVNIGVRELKFVRTSAMIDPMTNSEWEPVRARDPRIMKFLQAWAAQTLIQIPNQYLLLASAPQKSVFKNSDSSPANQPPGTGIQIQPPTSNPPNPTGPPRPLPGQVRPPTQNTGDDDDDDDDDDVSTDPLAHLFRSDAPGHSNAPIVGVASKKKGQAMNSYFGLDNYEDWIFLYIPKVVPQQGQPLQRPGQPNQQLKISQ